MLLRAPDLPAGPRDALIVATTGYADPDLADLRAPAQDSADMAEVLGDPGIGGFAVSAVRDKLHHEVRHAIGEFLADRRPRDTVLLYLSCHGLLNPRGDLYFATADTMRGGLSYTAVEASWLRDRLEECDAGRRILILDCCHSGSFPGIKAATDLDLERRLIGSGRGVDLLAASRASEYSYETDLPPDRQPVRSVFTGALVDGIRSGAADTDKDGLITVEDAYFYAEDALRAAGANQSPQYSRSRGEGKIFLARAPRNVTVTSDHLPEDLRVSLGSRYPEVRAGAVKVLGSWLRSADPAEVLAAQTRLAWFARNDTADVAEVARTLLAAPDDLITSYPSARPGPAGAQHGVGITVLVTDLARSITFYRDLLGFVSITAGDSSAVLASGDTRLVLRQVPDVAGRPGRQIYLNLEVGDVEAVYQQLTSAGIRFVHAPRAVNRGDKLELWAATFSDPDGHSIAITQWQAIRRPA